MTDTAISTHTDESVADFSSQGANVAGREHAADRPGEPAVHGARRAGSPGDRAKELQQKLHAGGFAGICFRASTAGSDWIWPTRRRSTPSAAPMRCR